MRSYWERGNAFIQGARKCVHTRRSYKEWVKHVYRDWANAFMCRTGTYVYIRILFCARIGNGTRTHLHI